MASHPNLESLCIVENYYGSNLNAVFTNETAKTDAAMEEGKVPITAMKVASNHAHPKLMKHLSIMGEDSPLLNPHTIGMKRKKPCSMSLAALWKWYTLQIEDRPLVTKAITAGTLVSMGNYASQCLPMLYHNGGIPPSIHWYQTFEFFLMGVLLQAPVTHYYYLVLDDLLPPTPSPWTFVTFVKLMIDQLIFGPSFLAGVFIFLDILDGKSISGIQRHLVSDWPGAIVANWKLWVPATFVNLAFCPPCYRVLFANVVFFVWSIILSTLVHDSSTVSPNTTASGGIATNHVP